MVLTGSRKELEGPWVLPRTPCRPWTRHREKLCRLQSPSVWKRGEDSSTPSALLRGMQTNWWAGERAARKTKEQASPPGPRLSYPGPRALRAEVRPAKVTHRARSSRKITLLQQPANTRPTAKAGRMAGAGKGERACRGRARLYGHPKKPGCCVRRGTAHAHRSAAGLSFGAAVGSPSPAAATNAAGRGAVVRNQPGPHSSEGASRSEPDYTSQDAARPHVRLCGVPPQGSSAREESGPRCPSCLARKGAAGLAGK